MFGLVCLVGKFGIILTIPTLIPTRGSNMAEFGCKGKLNFIDIMYGVTKDENHPS